VLPAASRLPIARVAANAIVFKLLIAFIVRLLSSRRLFALLG
jgi:hypothetical protein